MNELFRAARLRTESSVNPGFPLSRRDLAVLVDEWIYERLKRRRGIDEVYVGKVERGDIGWPNADYRSAFRAVLNVASDTELGFTPRASPRHAHGDATTDMRSTSGGVEALELMRRVEATDVGDVTITALTRAVEGIACSYTHVAPADHLATLITYQRYMARLLDARATLSQRKELMRQAGWLSLLAATAYMDLGYLPATAMNLEVARGLARETGDTQLSAWTIETSAWQYLSNGDPSRAVELCEAGFEVAPADSPSFVQLCTQAARANARLGDSEATRRWVDEGLDTVERLPSSTAERSHFGPDPRRTLAHCAAALVWLDDPTEIGETFARRAVDQYETSDPEDQSVHHLATSRMNLALHLARANEPGEAARLGGLAFESAWRLCATDLFLASDLDRVLRERYEREPDVIEFHDRYLELHSVVTSRPVPSRPVELTVGGGLAKADPVDHEAVRVLPDALDPESGRQ